MITIDFCVEEKFVEKQDYVSTQMDLDILEPHQDEVNQSQYLSMVGLEKK
jgi:hypothetical protein